MSTREWRLVETGCRAEWLRLEKEVAELARSLGGLSYRSGISPAGPDGAGFRGFISTDSEELARAWEARQANERVRP